MDKNNERMVYEVKIHKNRQNNTNDKYQLRNITM